MSQLAPITRNTKGQQLVLGPTKACRCRSSGCPLLLIDVPVIDFHATNAVQVTAWPLIYLIALRHTITFSLCCITASELVCQPNKLSWVGGGWCKNVGLFDQEEVYFSLFSLFRSFILVNLWMLESGSFQYFQCGAWVLSWKSIFLAPGAASVSAFIVEMPLDFGLNG